MPKSRKRKRHRRAKERMRSKLKRWRHPANAESESQPGSATDLESTDNSERRHVGPAQALADYAQPLINKYGHTKEGLENAMNLTMLCWNLAIHDDPRFRDKILRQFKQETKMPDDLYSDFLTLVSEMIERHKRMFPRMHEGESLKFPRPTLWQRLKRSAKDTIHGLNILKRLG